MRMIFLMMMYEYESVGIPFFSSLGKEILSQLNK